MKEIRPFFQQQISLSCLTAIDDGIRNCQDILTIVIAIKSDYLNVGQKISSPQL